MDRELLIDYDGDTLSVDSEVLRDLRDTASRADMTVVELVNSVLELYVNDERMADCYCYPDEEEEDD